MCVPVVGIWGAEYIGWLAKEDEQEADEEQGKDMNGEVVREGVESWKKGLMSRSLYWGLGTFVGLVGIWGDGGKVRRMR